MLTALRSVSCLVQMLAQTLVYVKLVGWSALFLLAERLVWLLVVTMTASRSGSPLEEA